MKITTEELGALLSTIHGNTIGSISTKTTAHIKGGKKNELTGKTFKLRNNTNVMMFSSSKGYKNMLKKKMGIRPLSEHPCGFRLEPRIWGRRLPTSCLVEYKNKLYAEVIILKEGKIHYEFKNKPIDCNAVLYKEKEDLIKIRCFALENINKVKMYGEEFIVDD